MAYTRVNWENRPSTNTPINATNLNKMDKGIKDLEDDLTTFEASLATVATSGDYDDLTDTPNLSTVATSGDYDDLSNKPTIPTNSSIVDLIYPVGSIYMSVNNTSPATLFGGTWERIQDQFLLSAGSTYSAGSTGGSASHKITSAELPKHTHTYAKPNANTNSHTLTEQQIPSHSHKYVDTGYNFVASIKGVTSGASAVVLSDAGTAPGSTTTTGGGQGHSHGIGTTSTASGDGGFANNSFSTLPPYLAVYVWKRTA